MSLYVWFQSPGKYALYCVICRKDFTSLFERGLGISLIICTFAGSVDMPLLENMYPNHRTLSLFLSYFSCLKVNPLSLRACRTLCRLQLCISCMVPYTNISSLIWITPGSRWNTRCSFLWNSSLPGEAPITRRLKRYLPLWVRKLVKCRDAVLSGIWWNVWFISSFVNLVVPLNWCQSSCTVGMGKCAHFIARFVFLISTFSLTLFPSPHFLSVMTILRANLMGHLKSKALL